MTNGSSSSQGSRQAPTANGTATDPSKQKAPQQPVAPPKQTKPQKQQSKHTEPPYRPQASPEAQANGSPSDGAAGSDAADWSDDQQSLLIKALKEISKDESDRCAAET